MPISLHRNLYINFYHITIGLSYFSLCTFYEPVALAAAISMLQWVAGGACHSQIDPINPCGQR